ncbi:MAG: trypsin-like peptidase domain-containing protein [Thermoanaerobaculia bacterium]
MKRLFFLYLLISVFSFSQEKIGEEARYYLATPHPYPSTGFSEMAASIDYIYHPGASLIKVHFSKFELAKGHYLVLRDPEGKFSYKYEEKGPLGTGEFYAAYIPGDMVLIELFTPDFETSYGYEIDHYYWGYKDYSFEWELPTPETVCGSTDWKNAKCYSGTVYEKAKTVTRYIYVQNPYMYACTGWLVGCQGHVLSNNHCISSQKVLDTADFEFMAEASTCASTSCDDWGACPGPIWSGTKTFVVTNSTLDYSLYLLGGNPQNTYGYLQARNSDPVVGEQIFIPQHPSAWAKKIAFDSDMDSGGKCKVLNLNNNACATSAPGLHYYCDTAGGSSGSPVIAVSDYYVVGLHNCGGCTNSGIQIDNVGADLQSKGKLPDGFWAGSSCGGSCTPPSAPTNLSITGNCNQVSLTWNSVSGASGYNIYRYTGTCTGATWTKIGTTTSTTYTDTAVTVGTTYAYVVRAYAGTDTCESANSSCLSTTVQTPPSPPAAPTVTDACNGLSLTWSASTGATSYNVYRRSGGCGNNGWSPVQSGITSTSWTDTTAALGTTYGYYIEAVNSCGTATNGKDACGSGTHSLTTPSAPTNLAATGTCASVNLTWNTVSGATSYKILRTTNSDCSTGLTQIGTSSTNSYSDTTATAGTTYYYVVRATNSCGDSSNSNCVSGVRLSTPSAPTNLTATGTCSGVNLTWNSVSGATSYNILRTTNSNCSTGLSQIGTSTTNSYTDTTASGGTTYYYVVQAVNSCGASQNSNCASATALSVPSAPSAPTYTNVSCTTLTVNWTAVPGATSYDLYRKLGPCGTGSLLAGNLSGTSYNDSGLTQNTQYSYYLFARNSCGTSAQGACSSVTTTSAPSAPANLSATGTCTGIDLTWNASTGATSYNILRTTNSNCTTGLQQIGTSATTSYSDNTAQAGITYYYVVRGVNECGESGNSNCASSQKLTSPSAPSITNITDESTCAQSGIRIYYNPGTGATSHSLYRDGSLAQSNYSSGSLYNPGDTNSHSYFIRATNSCGSTDSPAQSFTDINNSRIPTITGPSSNTCPSTTVLLSTQQGMTNYQWYLNGEAILGANSYEYQASQSGNYTVSYTNIYGCTSTSDPFSVTINPCIPNIVYFSNSGLVPINEDGDGVPEAGEKWQLTVTVKNIGQAPATNVFGSLAGEGLSLCNNPGSFGNIDINQTSSYTFIFIIDSNYWYSTYSCGSSIGFDLVSKTSNGGAYIYPNDLNFLIRQVGQTGGTTTQNATGPDLTNIKNGSKTSTLSPSFTLTPTVSSASVSFTLSGDTDLVNCVMVELLAPDLSASVLKNYGQSAQSSYDVTSFYNQKGAGTYALRVTEASSCGSASANANCTSISMSVSKITGVQNCDTSSFTCANIAGEVSNDSAHHLKLYKNGNNVDILFEDIGAQYYNLYISNKPETNPFKVFSSTDGKKQCHITINNDLGEMLQVLNYNLENGITGDTSKLFILVTADNGTSTEGSLGYNSSNIERTADSYCNK